VGERERRGSSGRRHFDGGCIASVAIRRLTK
jgi:hypothetical protein